jgi:hypothetical protein
MNKKKRKELIHTLINDDLIEICSLDVSFKHKIN